MKRQMIDTRVCIDDILGPFDCKLDPTFLWNGFLSPNFTLPVTRELSAQTLRMADEYGYDCTFTIHVIDGRADSPETVHIIESGLSRYNEDQGKEEDLAVAVRINWRSGTARIGDATPKARKAARKSKVTGRGAARAIVAHVRWQDMGEGSQSAANIVDPSDGLYGIGCWEWCWGYAVWWCVCGSYANWHETDCLCGLTRDDQPTTPLGVATWAAGETLRRLAPEATSAEVDLHGQLARIISVFAGDTEIDTADDTGPFDCETLGEADEILRAAFDEADPGTPEAAGWQLVPHEKTDQLYRITFAPISE